MSLQMHSEECRAKTPAFRTLEESLVYWLTQPVAATDCGCPFASRGLVGTSPKES